MDAMDGPPEPRLPQAEEDELKLVGEVAWRIHRAVNPSPVVGHATEHSIEDPFTGEVTVTMRLA
ncbi:hypothetical protein ACGFIW_01535 [Micromonospora sp. NPDC048935]|uniref:hypothetical protein n=1 Tax=Micromonospora sp. NPDC048935 TaxID=3364262 RepID=UPI00371FCC7B